MSHGTRINESWHTWERVMAHVGMSHDTHMTHTLMTHVQTSHGIHVNESWHTWG